MFQANNESGNASSPSKFLGQDSAYVKFLDGILECISAHHSHLFGEEELRLLSVLTSFHSTSKPKVLFHDEVTELGGSSSKLSRESLSWRHICLIARMILRKNTWLKSSSIAKYIPGSSPQEIREIVNQLQELDIITIINESSPFEDVWRATTECFDMSDVKLLCSIIRDVKCTTKDESFSRLYKVLTTRRGIDGKLSSSRLGKVVLDILKKNYSASEYLVSLSPNALRIIRRFHRLAHIAADMEALRMGEGRSVLAPTPTSAALLVAFGKIRFPKYEIAGPLNIFTGRVQFECWEAAQEIQYALRCALNSELNECDTIFALHLPVNIQIFRENSAATACLDSCIHAARAISDPFLQVLVIIMFIIADLRESSLLKSFANETEALTMLDAGYLLACSCHSHLSVLEKDPYKNFPLAILLLRLLLSCDYTPHRRGKWYRRLCINLDTHMKNKVDCEMVLEYAISDRRVQLGDATDIRNRFDKFQKKSTGSSSKNDVNRRALLFNIKAIIADLLDFCKEISSVVSKVSNPILNLQCNACTFRNAKGAVQCEVCLTQLLQIGTESNQEIVDLTFIADDYNDNDEVEFILPSRSSKDERSKTSLSINESQCSYNDNYTLVEADCALLGIISNTESNVKVVEVSGRRFGDSARKGKNLFWGFNDKSLYVEQYVEEIFQRMEQEDSSDSSIELINFKDGGGWEGFHDEGIVIRSLVCLLLWDVLFSSYPNAFLSLYQDAPLDLFTPSFYKSRESIIERTLWKISEMHSEDLLVYIGTIYRDNYRCNCKGILWNIPLPVLQLVAVCIGTKGLRALCFAFCVNFKYFLSGAPDLILLRIRREISKSGAIETVPISNYIGENWKSFLYPDKLTDFELDYLSPITVKKQKIVTTDTLKKNDLIIAFEESEFTPVPRFECPYPVNFDSLSQDLKYSYFQLMFIEVKGPSDRLSTKQLTWLNLLDSNGVKAIVCRIKEEKTIY